MTQTEIIKSSLPNMDSEIIKQFLKDDSISPLKRQMRIGERYFEGKHDICYKKLNEYTIKDLKTENGVKKYTEKTIEVPNRSLVKVAHRYHWKLVKQKRDYTVGKPITITYEPIIEKELNETQKTILKKINKQIVDKFWNVLGISFDNFLRQTIVDMSNKVYAVWFPYYDEQGNFKYTRIEPKEIIPIYDTKTQKTLTDILHTYKIIENDKKKVYVEWATAENTKYFIEDKNEITKAKEYLLDVSRINPEPHWVTQTLFNGQLTKIEKHSWGKVPYIIIKNK